VHTWLPDAHTQAPTAGSVILAGVMLKLGTYGFLRFGLYLFPEAAVWAAPACCHAGVIGIVYGAICATMQKDLKRVVAYSSVAHLGFIVLGTFSITTQGLQGSVLQMVNHGLSTGALFLLVGMIYERRHTREIAKLKGLQKPAPILAAVFTVVMLSSIGLPGLNGFVGEFLILIGLVPHLPLVGGRGRVGRDPRRPLPALGLPAGVPRRARRGQRLDPRPAGSEGFVLAPLVVLIVVMGLYPKPFIERIEPAVDRLVRHVEANSDYVEPRVATEGEQIVPAVRAARRRPREADEHADATTERPTTTREASDAGPGPEARHPAGRVLRPPAHLGDARRGRALDGHRRPAAPTGQAVVARRLHGGHRPGLRGGLVAAVVPGP
jgi:NADH-quinone oxidoreductase subunit M